MFFWYFYFVMSLLIICAPRLRRLAIILFAVVFIKHAYGILSGMYSQVNARKLITPSEVVLSDLKEERDMNFRKLNGRITNRSQKYCINYVPLKIYYKDCPVEGAANNCMVIGEESSAIMKYVLPGETVEFSAFLETVPPVPKNFLMVERVIDYVEASKYENKIKQ